MDFNKISDKFWGNPLDRDFTTKPIFSCKEQQLPGEKPMCLFQSANEPFSVQEVPATYYQARVQKQENSNATVTCRTGINSVIHNSTVTLSQVTFSLKLVPSHQTQKNWNEVNMGIFAQKEKISLLSKPNNSPEHQALPQQLLHCSVSCPAPQGYSHLGSRAVPHSQPAPTVCRAPTLTGSHTHVHTTITALGQPPWPSG